MDLATLEVSFLDHAVKESVEHLAHLRGSAYVDLRKVLFLSNVKLARNKLLVPPLLGGYLTPNPEDELKDCEPSLESNVSESLEQLNGHSICSACK